MPTTDPQTRPGTTRVVADQRGGNLALDVFVLHQHLGTLLEHALGGTGVSASQYAVYSQLAHGARSPKQLVELLGLRPATLSGYLAAMELRGHLERTRDPHDGRGHRLELTDAGRVVQVECRTRFRSVLGAVDRRLGGAAGVAALRAGLGELDQAITEVLAAVGGGAR